MPRKTCRSLLTTVGGDLDLRTMAVYAADVEGRPCGRVRSQLQLAELEARHGRVLLGAVSGPRAATVAERLRVDGPAGWSFLLAGGDGMAWTVSRQANVRSVIDAAATCPGREPGGDSVRLGADEVAELRTESGARVALPRPDRLRFGLALPARDPGPGWGERFARLAGQAAAPGAAAKSEQAAGAVLSARAWHLAAGDLAGDLSAVALRCGLWDPAAGPCPPPERLLAGLDGLCAVWEVRQNALFDLGMDDGVEELAEQVAAVDELRVRWMRGYADAARSLLVELRPFGPPAGFAPLLAAGDVGGAGVDAGAAVDAEAVAAVSAALGALPSDWVAALPPMSVRRTGDREGFAGLYQFDRSSGCALVSVRADAQLGDPVAVAAHELVHGVQLSTGLGARVRAAEEAFLRALPTVSAADGVEVRLPVPGDDYAGVWNAAERGLPSEFLPQLLAWLAFDPARSADPGSVSEWARRSWPGAPDALHLGLGLLGSV